MTEPCDSKPDIRALQVEAQNTKASLHNMETGLTKLVDKMDVLINQMSVNLQDSREFRTLLVSQAKDIDSLYGEIRELRKEELEPLGKQVAKLVNWQSEVKGMFRLAVIIPTAISVILTLVTLYEKIHYIPNP